MSELERLRDRVTELEELLGLADNEIYAMLGLPKLQRSLLGLLMKRPLVSRDTAFAAIYGDRPEASQPEIKILDVHLSHLRGRLRGLGVTITTRWGEGWYLVLEEKAKLRSLLESQG